ncbi:MAG TPA: hypothetical protein VGJ93_04940 [Desulfuromonadaceae bacterium]
MIYLLQVCLIVFSLVQAYAAPIADFPAAPTAFSNALEKKHHPNIEEQAPAPAPTAPAPTAPAPTTPAPTAPSADQYLIQIDATALQKFGLYYPVTYKFRLPSGSNNLISQYRYGEETWQTLPEKIASDIFNGLDAVRFDYAGGFAYVSVRFSRSSDSIYLSFIDANGQPIPVEFDSISKYYDDRQAVVTITLDDWGSWSDSAFRAASDYLGSYGLYFTVGLITNGYLPWSSVQQKIDQHGDKLEIASHGANHVCNAADYATSGYETEIIGSRDAIRQNLQYGTNPYVSVYMEPCGYSDATLNNWVSAGDYLLTRGIGGRTTPFVDWNPLLERYDSAGVTFDTYKRADDASLLSLANAAFDGVLAAGTIYHLTDHPPQGLWHDNSYLLQHFNYIKGRSSIWYVPFGQLYQYHFIQELRGNLKVQHLGNSTRSGLNSDLNGDGKTDIRDALRSLQIATGTIIPTPADLVNGDVAPVIDGKSVPDGKIDIRDTMVILKRILNLAP